MLPHTNPINQMVGHHPPRNYGHCVKTYKENIQKPNLHLSLPKRLRNDHLGSFLNPFELLENDESA